MKEQKVRGIVLRQTPMGDKDKRVVLLTQETGRMTLLAKGAMLPKSRFSALTQVFCYGDYVVTKGRTFYYIREATLIENFYDLTRDLEKLAYGSLMLEAAETFSVEGVENNALVVLLLRALYQEERASSGKESLPADVFLFRLLAMGGFYPNLNRCSRCGRPLDHMRAEETVAFNPLTGSVICEDCQPQGGLRLSRGTVRALRYILEAPEERAFSFEVSEQVKGQLDTAVTSFLVEQTERQYHALAFLDELHRKPDGKHD